MAQMGLHYRIYQLSRLEFLKELCGIQAYLFYLHVCSITYYYVYILKHAFMCCSSRCASAKMTAYNPALRVHIDMPLSIHILHSQTLCFISYLMIMNIDSQQLPFRFYNQLKVEIKHSHTHTRTRTRAHTSHTRTHTHTHTHAHTHTHTHTCIYIVCCYP